MEAEKEPTETYETLTPKVIRTTATCRHLGSYEDEPGHWYCPDCWLGRYGIPLVTERPGNGTLGREADPQAPEPGD